MKVAVIGRTQILYETALRLHENGHQIGCIITAKAAPEYTRNADDFRDLADRLGVPFLYTQSLDRPEAEELCRGLDIGVSVNWVSVIRQKQIDWFRLGILNSHHGDLPKYRGNACSNWAIIKGEEEIVCTIHFMEGDQLDCGRIVHQERLRLSANTTIADVYRWSEESTPPLFVEALRRLDADSDLVWRFADPNSPQSFRCYPRLPEDGYIDWTLPVSTIHNLIRAVSSPFAGAYTYHWHQGEVRKLIVLKSRIVQLETNDLSMHGHVLANHRETGESHVRCGDGVIALLECCYDDEQESFAPGTRWKSIRMRLGVRAQDWLWELQRRAK